VQISREDLSRRYVSLSDEELLALDRNELTKEAQECYDSELARRRLSQHIAVVRNTSGASETELISDDAEPMVYAPGEVEPDWLETAATACSFQVGTPSRYDAERACAILRNAGIPSQIVSQTGDGGTPDLINVMVPGALSLKASSVLDCELFNEELEETWRSHFDGLSDEELRALQPDDICAGLLDRAARLKRVYEEALARRPWIQEH
jgi:hypothetical protein